MKPLPCLVVVVCLALPAACGGDREAQTLTESSALEDLGEGLRWRGRELERVSPKPKVRRVPVPETSIAAFTSLGVAYEIDYRGPALTEPVMLEIPLPDEAFTSAESLVFLKLSPGTRTLLLPSAVDRERKTASLLMESFSTLVPGMMDSGQPSATLIVNLDVVVESEDDPSTYEGDFLFTSVGPLVSGASVHQAVHFSGVGSHQLTVPVPLFGTYQLHGLWARSEHFHHGSPAPFPKVTFDDIGATYTVDLDIVPTTTRLEGGIVDGRGHPACWVALEVTDADGVSFETVSNEWNGEYEVLSSISLGAPTYRPEATLPYRLWHPNDDLCHEVSGDSLLTGGKTEREDFTYLATGAVDGRVASLAGEPLAGARIVLSTNGECQPNPVFEQTFEASTSEDGLFDLFDIPVGRAEITATCPDGRDTETKIVSISCGKVSVEPDVEFVLDCSEAASYRLSYQSRYSDDLPHAASTFEGKAEFSFTPREPEAAAETITVRSPLSTMCSMVGKEVDGTKISYVPSSFMLSTGVEWTIERELENGHECFQIVSAEIVEEHSQTIRSEQVNLLSGETLNGTAEYGSNDLLYNLFMPHDTELGCDPPLEWKWSDCSGGVQCREASIRLTKR